MNNETVAKPEEKKEEEVVKVAWVETDLITEYGLTQRLSFSVRIF